MTGAKHTSLEKGDAYFSPDRHYRYALSRVWGDGPMMLFIGLNPSTADETKLDPTMRRVLRFAQREGCGGMWMGNLFAIRATDPLDMRRHFSPIGPDNDQWLLDMAHWCANKIVCGWGTHGGWLDREREVIRLLDGHKLHCLGQTKDGHPRHPLYLSSSTPLDDYTGPKS